MKKETRAVLLGIPIGQPSLDSAIAEAQEAIEHRRKPIVFATANTRAIVMTQSDPVFFQAMSDADQMVADGVGVKIMSHFVHGSVGPRIVGEEYFSALMDALEQRGRGRVFFFGSSNDTLRKIENRFKQQYPSLTL